MSTGIEWCDETWNPTTGCTKVSDGCDHCYAERVTERFHGPGAFERVVLHPERLSKPLHWRRPRRVFVDSMSDLFHDQVPDEFIARVFAVMAATPQHTYQMLTKRHGRMRSLLTDADAFAEQVARAAGRLVENGDDAFESVLWGSWPLPNVWLGVSVEDQKRADLRIPALLDTPAAVRFLSCEPLLGPVDLSRWMGALVCGCGVPPEGAPGWSGGCCAECMQPERSDIDWLIVGGESGADARPMHPEWARSLRDQCQAAEVPFFFKQWGEWARDSAKPRPKDRRTLALHPAGMTALTRDNPFDPFERGHPHWTALRRVGKEAAGRELDGRIHDEFPEVAGS